MTDVCILLGICSMNTLALEVVGQKIQKYSAAGTSMHDDEAKTHGKMLNQVNMTANIITLPLVSVTVV